MQLKAEDVFKDMDRLIEAYQIQGRAVPCLRLTPSQWTAMSNDFQKALKQRNYNYPVTAVEGKPYYKGYLLVKHVQAD